MSTNTLKRSKSNSHHVWREVIEGKRNWRDLSLKGLCVPPRILKPLSEANIVTLGQVAEQGLSQIQAIKGIGKIGAALVMSLVKQGEAIEAAFLEERSELPELLNPKRARSVTLHFLAIEEIVSTENERPVNISRKMEREIRKERLDKIVDHVWAIAQIFMVRAD